MTNVYRVLGTNFHLLLSNEGEIVDALSLRSRKGRAAVINLLTTTTGEQRLEGETLHIGARGLATIAGAIYGSRSKPTPRFVYDTLSVLFRGDPSFSELLKGTIRAVFDQPAFGSDAYFCRRAEAQLQAKPFQPVQVRARIMVDGLPIEMHPVAP